MSPLITILIRTSNRPTAFRHCIDSVKAQTYTNWKVIVSIDRAEDLGYVRAAGISDHLFVYSDNSIPFFYNLYVNQLKEKVSEGFFFCLDDDDKLDAIDVLEKIAPHLTNESEAVICQFRRKGKPKPIDNLMDLKMIEKGKIGLPCLILHHSQKNIADLKGGVSWDDYNYIKEVSEKSPTKFVKQVVVNSEKRSFGL